MGDRSSFPNRLRTAWLLLAVALLLTACQPQPASLPGTPPGAAPALPALPTAPLPSVEQTGPAPTRPQTPGAGASATRLSAVHAATPEPPPVPTTAPTLVVPTSAPAPSPVAPSVVPAVTSTRPPAAPSPSATPRAGPAPAGQSVAILQPLLIDSNAGRIYAPAHVGQPARDQTAVLSAADGRVLALYDVAGPLGLDTQAGRLYVDLGKQGLAVLDAATGALLRTVELPAATAWSDGSPAPQADPATGQVFAMRNNSFYVIDPAGGQILRQTDFDLRPQDGCRSPHDALLPIAGSRYDPAARILYLDFVSYACTPYIGYTIVAYDVASGKELGRGSGWPFQAAVGGGKQYVWSWYRMGTGRLTLWRDGRPVSASDDWSGYQAAPYLDARRGRVYQNLSEGPLRVFDAASMRLLFVMPQPVASGQLAGFDPGADQLYFLSDGRVQAAPASRIAAPTAQAPAPAAASSAPVSLLALSPGYAADKTMFGAWGWEGPAGSCWVFGQMGGALRSSADGGRSFARPQSGLPGDCARISALAISPAYPQDHTVFVGIAGSGLFRSADGGALWQPASGEPAAGLPSMGIRQALLSPGYGRDHTVFVVGWSGPMQRSVDGGQTWAGIGKEGDALAALSPEFDQDGTLAAWGYGNPNQLRVSRDRGANWAPLSSPVQGQATLVGLSLAPAFARWQVMFAADSQGTLYRSADGGKSWHNVLSTGITNTLGAQIAYGPGETNRPVFLLAITPNYGTQPPGLTGKLFQSRDGGQTWQPLDPGAGVVPTALALSPAFGQDSTLFLGTSDGRVITLPVGM